LNDPIPENVVFIEFMPSRLHDPILISLMSRRRTIHPVPIAVSFEFPDDDRVVAVQISGDFSQRHLPAMIDLDLFSFVQC
jgi:predicted nucleotidyltransferase